MMAAFQPRPFRVTFVGWVVCLLALAGCSRGQPPLAASSTPSSTPIDPDDCEALLAWDSYRFLPKMPLDCTSPCGRYPYVTCDAAGHVTELNLFNMPTAVQGPLPESLAKLTKLKRLNLASNKLTGELPASWSALTGLEFLHLFQNQLTGNLPPIWSNMAAMKDMKLANNTLSGELPAAWGALTRLQYLDLSSCAFTGGFPSAWGKLGNMKELYLYNNAFDTPIPNQWSSMKSLEKLFIYNTNCGGEVPGWLGSLPALTAWNLQNNKMGGTLPSNWSRLTKAVSMGMANNEITGTLPASWADLKAIQEIGLEDNKISGPLPKEWSQMTQLKKLALSGNGITGNIPEDWGSMVKLQTLWLDNTLVAGSLPTRWRTAQLTELRVSNYMCGQGTSATTCTEPPTTRDPSPELPSSSSTSGNSTNPVVKKKDNKKKIITAAAASVGSVLLVLLVVVGAFCFVRRRVGGLRNLKPVLPVAHENKDVTAASLTGSLGKPGSPGPPGGFGAAPPGAPGAGPPGAPGTQYWAGPPVAPVAAAGSGPPVAPIAEEPSPGLPRAPPVVAPERQVGGTTAAAAAAAGVGVLGVGAAGAVAMGMASPGAASGGGSVHSNLAPGATETSASSMSLPVRDSADSGFWRSSLGGPLSSSQEPGMKGELLSSRQSDSVAGSVAGGSVATDAPVVGHAMLMLLPVCLHIGFQIIDSSMRVVCNNARCNQLVARISAMQPLLTQLQEMYAPSASGTSDGMWSPREKEALQPVLQNIHDVFADVLTTVNSWCSSGRLGSVATVLRNMATASWFQENFVELNMRLTGAFADLTTAMHIQDLSAKKLDPKTVMEETQQQTKEDLHGLVEQLATVGDDGRDVWETLSLEERQKVASIFAHHKLDLTPVVKTARKEALEKSASKLLIPWGEIRKTRLVGKGGYGAVYAGTWKHTRVALKWLDVGALTDRDKADVLREAYIHHRAQNHPNIIPLYGITISKDNECMLVMELANGDMQKLVSDTEVVLTTKRMYHLALEVAQGLEHLHEKGIVHGDLKPSNVLVRASGALAVSDFGLSSINCVSLSASISAARYSLNSDSTALTICYSPPEFLSARATRKTQAGDVYAFAMVLLEVFTGDMPYAGLPREAVLRTVLAGSRPPIPTRVPEGCARLISQCWDQEAERRPTFKDICECLQQLHDAEP